MLRFLHKTVFLIGVLDTGLIFLLRRDVCQCIFAYLEHQWYSMGMWKLQCMCKLSICHMYECVCMPIDEIMTWMWPQCSVFDFCYISEISGNPYFPTKTKEKDLHGFSPTTWCKDN